MTEKIRERTYAGLATARARGRKGVRREPDPDKQAAIVKMADQSPAVVCKTLGISRSTFYKYAYKPSATFSKWTTSVMAAMKKMNDPKFRAEIEAKIF